VSSGSTIPYKKRYFSSKNSVIHIKKESVNSIRRDAPVGVEYYQIGP